jgi:hypothetical protein
LSLGDKHLLLMWSNALINVNSERSDLTER